MTSRPPSAGAVTTSSSSRGGANPTPHNAVSRSRGHSSLRVPPQAPKASRRPTPTEASSNALPPNPPFPLLPRGTSGPRSSWTKADDILAPPDTQSSPFAKAGLKVVGAGTGAYGELDGWLDWPAELYANERVFRLQGVSDYLGKERHIAREIKAIYSQDEQLRSKGMAAFMVWRLTVDTTTRLTESLGAKVDKLKEDEWMYASTDTLFARQK